jgi:nicotinate-nucleotide--dimethylbenzimidazole phosphoribosyltransferase
LADQLAAQSPAGQNPAGQNPAGQSPPGKAALSTSGVGAPPEAAPRDAAPRNAAAPDPAEAARQPPPVEPAARATAATKVEAPSAAVAATLPSVQTVTTENAKIGTPRVGGTAPPAEPPALAQTDQPRPATTPVAQPAVAQPAVAPPAVADAAGAQGSGQPMAPAPSGGTDHARPGVPPVQPKPGTQTPSPAEAELAQSGLQPNQAPGGGRQAVALAMLAASHGVSHSPGQVGQTSQAGQPHAAVRAARVEEPV